MSESLRTDATRAPEGASEVDCEAKIEQLLLAGLEHYFASRYDQAINVWTRALFLDRGHARARAYIERARSALAERQRESEELLERGVAAFRRGDGEEARRLLQGAIDRGAPPDEALPILERLNRLQRATPPVAPASPGRTRLRAAAARVEKSPRASRAAWVALGLMVLVILGAGAFAGGVFRAEWRLLLARPAPQAPAVVRTAPDDRLPLPRRGETALARARSLAAGGRFRDALRALDRVQATDAQRPDADRLRADIQKQLISLNALPASLASGPERSGSEP